MWEFRSLVEGQGLRGLDMPGSARTLQTSGNVRVTEGRTGDVWRKGGEGKAGDGDQLCEHIVYRRTDPIFRLGLAGHLD